MSFEMILGLIFVVILLIVSIFESEKSKKKHNEELDSVQRYYNERITGLERTIEAKNVHIDKCINRLAEKDVKLNLIQEALES